MVNIEQYNQYLFLVRRENIKIEPNIFQNKVDLTLSRGLSCAPPELQQPQLFSWTVISGKTKPKINSPYYFCASHLFLYLLLRRCFVVIQHLGKLLYPCQGLVDSPHFLTLSRYIMLHQAIGAIITLANAAHCFSISWAWLKFCGFCSESDVDFSAVLSQGISWWLRPQGWNSIWIETSNNRNFRHKLIIVIHHLL